MFDQFHKECGRCGGSVEMQMFHQVKLHKCVACGNVMMEGDDLNNLVSSDATDLPKVTPVTPRTIIPNVPPPAKTSSKPIHSSAAQGMLSIASDTILPPEPREDSPAPPQRRNRSFLSRATTQPPKVPVPKPPDEKNKQEPALGLDFIGVDKTRDEPTLGLPGTQKNEDLFKSMSDDDTEELERNFFTEDNAEFPTEETELWTEEDENALAQFASGRRRKGFGLAVGGLLILAAIILIPIGVVLVTYAPPEANDSSTSTTPVDIEEDALAKDSPVEKAVGEEPKDKKAVSAPPPTEDKAATAPNGSAAAPPKQEEPPPVEVKKPKNPPKPTVEAKPKAPSRKRFINEGWKLVESNPSRAAKSFRQALDLKQGDFEANYGYGYAMLKQGDPEGAKHYLCMASGSNNRETQREVLAVLNRHGMSCN